MNVVQIYIYQEDDQCKQKQYLLKQASQGSKFRIIGTVVKSTPKTVKTTKLMLLDIITSELLIIDKDIVKSNIDKLDVDLSLSISSNRLRARHDILQKYPRYTSPYSLYDDNDKNKGVIVAVKEKNQAEPLYSVMNTCILTEFGDYKNATLTFYTEKELIDQITNNKIQLINGELKDNTIETTVDRM